MGHFVEFFVFNGFSSISFRSNQVRLPAHEETAIRPPLNSEKQ
jgi:hypothetical protein